MKKSVYQELNKAIPGVLALFDPDRVPVDGIGKLTRFVCEAGVAGILVGSSLLVSSRFNEFVAAVKKHADKPVILFPGGSHQISAHADAIFFLSLLSGRNSQFLIGEQVKAVFEIKAWIDQGTIFGRKIRGSRDRNPNSGLASTFKHRKTFVPEGARYILFAFSLSSSSPHAKVIERLRSRKICDSYAIVLRWEPKIEQERGKEPEVYNFDNSISRLIKWLRNLS